MAGPAAVWPGHWSGTYRPLAAPDIERIHATALDVLAEIGIGEPIPEILHYARSAGCTLSEDGRLLFPRGLVEKMMGVASRGYIRHAVEPANDIEITGERVYFCTSGEAVTVLDYAAQTFRPMRLVDLYDAARLVDRLPNIHCYGQPFIASELSEEVYARHQCGVRRTRRAEQAVLVQLRDGRPRRRPDRDVRPRRRRGPQLPRRSPAHSSSATPRRSGALPSST